MRKSSVFLFAVLLVAVLCSCTQDPYSDSRKIHVVAVGIDYTKTPNSNNHLIKNIDDAVQFAKCIEALSKQEVETTYLIGSDTSNITPYGITGYSIPTIANFESALTDLQSSVNPQDLVIFYFSTHGTTSDNIAKAGERYSYSEDAAKDASIVFLKGSQIDFDYYPVSTFLDTIADLPGGKVVVGDFCYSGALIRTNGVTFNADEYSDDPFITLLKADCSNVDPSVWCLASSRYYMLTPAGSGNHSTFTASVLEALGWNDTDLQNPYRTSMKATGKSYLALSDLASWLYKNAKVTGGSSEIFPVYTNNSDDVVLFDLK